MEDREFTKKEFFSWCLCALVVVFIVFIAAKALGGAGRKG
jgi:hypothetical protein